MTVRIGVGSVALFLLIQFIPYGHAHSNPPVSQAVRFDSPRTQQLAKDACYACHSNLTDWPWDSDVAPASWLVQRDVDEGRGILNFSEWDTPQPPSGEVSVGRQRGLDAARPVQAHAPRAPACRTPSGASSPLGSSARTWLTRPPV